MLVSTSKLPAELTILSGLQVDLAVPCPPAHIRVCGSVLNGAAEEGSAGEAGHGTIVNVLCCRLPAYLQQSGLKAAISNSAL